MKKFSGIAIPILLMVGVLLATGAWTYTSSILKNVNKIYSDSNGLEFKTAGPITFNGTSLGMTTTATAYQIDASGTLELEAEGLMTLDANAGLSADVEGQLVLDGATSVTISSAGAVYAQSVSGIAGTSLQPMKSVVLFLTATEAAATVTLAGGATFSGIGEYAIFLQPISTALCTTGTAVPLDGTRFVLTGGEGVTYAAFLLGN